MVKVPLLKMSGNMDTNMCMTDTLRIPAPCTNNNTNLDLNYWLDMGRF
jgi:formylmethanofuran dehydrogenase subunit E